MSSLIRYESAGDLTKLDLKQIEHRLIHTLKGRVQNAYVFGSFATGIVTNSSDIDLILLVHTDTSFSKRALDFEDLFTIHPNLDILVYTPAEFAKQMQENQGFWKSVKATIRQLI